MNSNELLKTLGLSSLAGTIDDDLIVEYGGESDNYIYINIEKKASPVYCPNCNTRMYSKGSILRKVRHPITHNGKQIIINLKQRKYRCTNKLCNLYLNEEFSFVDRYKQISVGIPYLILSDLKDVCLTCAAVSRKYQVSDTYVYDIMMRYVDFKPLPLSRVISIDEVYLNIEYDKRYVVIVTDFITGDVIEVLPNRNYDTLKSFFTSYSLEERKIVEYVISDMYEPYLNLPKKYLPSANSVVDSFHITQVIEKSIRNHINTVKKRYQKILDDQRKENNEKYNTSHKKMKDSVELVLLKKYDWVLLCKPGNEPDIDSRHFNRKLGIYPTLERIQKMFMDLDPYFSVFKELKDKYLDFNDEYVGKPKEAKEALKTLIKEFNESEYKIFKEFSKLLEEHFEQIIMSFNVIKKTNNKNEEFYQRLSNGPMEGFNRKPKDMKRLSRGFSNFYYVRNRILWSCRKNAPILAIPKQKAK